ncbi:hypothetical protein [uncultured Sphingomonas sp.]|uniref:hypothetical protein n=1 Tax=uncultured Sphingomonas sp. TaxID=158754 RepID=UPI002631DEBC|nr:hypothetical protein [uncultured Sphingomonas sp.]
MEEDFDEAAIIDLATAIQRGDRDNAFHALDQLIRDHANASAIRDRIDIARRQA